MNWSALLWVAAGFAAGALPFSAWLARAFSRKDIRQVGDGNPGAVNAWKAGSWKVGLPALWLDFLKAAVPVGLARWVFGVEGWWLVPVALAPVVGHAFSPFLRFRGGKAIAASFGAWCGLTLWQGPTVLGAGLALIGLFASGSAWVVAGGLVFLLSYLLLRGADAVLLVFWAADTGVLLWKHRREFLHKPGPGPLLRRKERT
jgi:glycerol-3-phosphate acyltransferase PlsY